MTKRVLVTGARDWSDVYTVMTALGEELEPGMTVVHGGCPDGADAMAEVWVGYWRDRVSAECHWPDWKTYGPAAGPIRNNHMVSLGADVCLAFVTPSSKGARQCARAAEAAGIPTFRYWSK